MSTVPLLITGIPLIRTYLIGFVVAFNMSYFQMHPRREERRNSVLESLMSAIIWPHTLPETMRTMRWPGQMIVDHPQLITNSVNFTL